VLRLFGPTNLADFTPSLLKTIRNEMITEGKCRRTINKTAVLIRAWVRWCVAEQLVHPSVLEALRAVKALEPGRSGAVEGEPRQPADPKAVDATLPHLPPAVQAVVRLLRLTGARPSEILSLRPCDLDPTKDVWAFTQPAHKTQWKGKSRVVHFGPEAQKVLSPWPGIGHEAFVFSPRRSEVLRNAQRSADRQTPRWPSHVTRNVRKRVQRRRRPPAERYTPNVLAKAVARGCIKAKVVTWTPYQLRHLKAVELRERYGLETVRAVLGQAAMSMSDHYSRGADDVLAGRAPCGSRWRPV
jgi:integrase